MEIRIKPNAYVHADSSKMRTFLKDNEGVFLPVETKYLFSNQYNTDDFRIFDSMIDCVIEDEREGKGVCAYCGKMYNAGEICLEYGPCPEYGIKWFTPKNTYFLGRTMRGEVPVFEKLAIGNYQLCSFPGLGYMRLYSARKTFNFLFEPVPSNVSGNGVFWVSNGIGFKAFKQMDIPDSIHKKLVKFLSNTDVLVK